jgi:hypothetical protein
VKSARCHRQITYFLFLILSALSFLSAITPHVNTQSLDLTASSYQAFNRLTQVYESGGIAPDLVAKLNVAIAQIQGAKILRAQGNDTGAAKLEQQAQSTITEVENAAPAAQLKAQQESISRTLLVIASIPVVVVVSTLIFYAALRTWRWYEKAKLFEMRIVEKKKTED